jgi:hypothetical protein
VAEKQMEADAAFLVFLPCRVTAHLATPLLAPFGFPSPKTVLSLAIIIRLFILLAMRSKNLLLSLVFGFAVIPFTTAGLAKDEAAKDRVTKNGKESNVDSEAPRNERPKKPNLEDAANRIRMHRAEVIKELGHDLDWTKYSSAELLDIELRIRAAQALRALDYDAFWNGETLDALLDKYARIEKARGLEKAGVNINWTKMSLEQLNDYEARIRKAEALKLLGRSVDWRKHTLKQLSDMQIQVLQYRRAR